jgi:DNA repair exonuclease SbcCD ATPase subunit
MKNFIPYEDAELALPERGIVFVTGPNFSGKSVLIDAVSTAIWNKTVRGPLGWKEKADGSVEVEAVGIDPFTCIRRRTPGGALKFEMSGGGEYGASKKAEERIEAQVGDWDTWRKTSVFLSTEAAVFTKASDGDRKRFIENLIGIDFDTALKKCRDDRRLVEGKVTAAAHQHALLTERLRHQTQRVRDLEGRVAAERTKQDTQEVKRLELKKKIEDLRFLMEECSQDLRGAGKERDEHRAALIKMQTELDELRKRVTRIDRDQCPTCEQSIPEGLRQKIRDDWRDRELVSKQSQVGVQQQLAAATKAVEDLQAESSTLSAQRDAHLREDAQLVHQLQEAKRAEEAAKRLDDDLASARVDQTKTQNELGTGDSAMTGLSTEAVELAAAEQVLGLRGFRAHLLGSVLEGIEAVVNVWLARLAGTEVQVRLHADGETQDGDPTGKVTIDIEGARWGAGRGYKALSQGQQRRIDFAVMLALADFAAGVRGRIPGTLWMDEVCDSLDKEGIAAAATVLREIAETQPIVLISHNDELFEAIGPDRHVKIVEGRILA